MKNKVWNFVKPIIVLTLIAAVMAALLGGTNLLTKTKIEILTAANEKAAVEKVIKAEKYEKLTLDYEGTEYTYFLATNKGEKIGYAFTLSQNGYGGAVKSVVGIGMDGKITAIEITDVSNETPGLGQNATKTSFTDQFKGKNSSLTVTKSGAKENEVNAITGATITSTAVTKSVNLAMDLFKFIEKEGDE
ncbi:MAG: RnfABCDGE type electron transport complex subunit G [Acutalibacteraceae bacterium]|nr:RnfABCDGE type electron transport complex subunit G [Acutalibacteraceae bacterium]